MSFLLDTLGIGDSEEAGESEGYSLNYVIGSTTGMDVTQDVPSYIARRAGKFAQFGGETLEILLKNPETFEVDREELLTTLSGLGFDTISLHGDPNVSFTTQISEEYSAARRYFTDYLNGVARFKSSIDANSQIDFDVSYINMHSSVESMPGLRSQGLPSATDVFGKDVNRVNGVKSPNIYSNKEFLKSVFDVLRATEDVELYNLYQAFAIYCSTFNKDWERAKHMVLNSDLWEGRMDVRDKTDALAAHSTRAAGFDQALTKGFEETEEITLGVSGGASDPEVSGRSLSEILSQIKEGDTPVEIPIGPGQGRIFLTMEFEDDEKSAEQIFEEALSRVWKGASDDGVLDERERISVQAKTAALQSAINFGGGRQGLKQFVRETAAEKSYGNGDTVFDRAKKAFSGQVDYYRRDDENGYKDESGRPHYLDIIEDIVGSIPLFTRKSSLTYYVIPAWICNSDYEATEEDEEYGSEERRRPLHRGWSVPSDFIWDAVVGSDMPKPSDGKAYKNKLESDFGFRQDVAAAVGITYTWSHFTVVESDFSGERQDEYRSENEPVLRTGSDLQNDVKWVEWMAEHDIGVNLEAFYNPQPGGYFLVWRPKDIAIACHAVNMESSLMGIDKDLLKFTIDMEHTASFGVDPEKEMNKLIESERSLASRDDVPVDPEKPLANVLTAYHLTRPGFETRNNTGHLHGEIRRGDKMLYRYLYRLVENGFCRGDSQCVIVFEIAGNYSEDIYVTRVMMDLLELGLEPSELSPSKVPEDGDYDSEEHALIARFFGIDGGSKQEEWTRIRQNAFNPLKELLEAEDFDNTHTGNYALNNNVRPNSFQKEEFK